MLPKINRLKKEDFTKIAERGRFFAAGSIALKILENEKNIQRIGFSIGKKFSKKAAERNAIRRKLREIFRGELKKIKKQADILVIIGKKNIKNRNLTKDVQEVLKKSGLTS